MFRDAGLADRQRTASSFEKAFTRYAQDAEKWFDGTVNSVDRRLAQCDRLLHSAQVTVARMSIHDSANYLKAAEQLSDDRRVLQGMREDMLNGFANREDVTGSPGWRTAIQRDKDAQDAADVRRSLYRWDTEGDREPPDWEGYGKYDFYSDTDPIPVDTVSENSGIDPGVIEMRRHDLKKMVPPGGKTAAGMPPMQQPATVAPQQGGYQVTSPVAKPPKPPKLKQPAPEVAMTPPKMPAAPKAAALEPDPSYDPAEFLDDGYHPSQEYLDRRRELDRQWEQRHKEFAAPKLAGTDQRWVTLEAAKFIAANPDALDDGHELATRAHHHAALKTSTFTPTRSAAVCEAFVATVTQLGHRRPRPRVASASPVQVSFPDSLMYL